MVGRDCIAIGGARKRRGALGAEDRVGPHSDSELCPTHVREQGGFPPNSGVFSPKYCGGILMYSDNTYVFYRILG